MGFIQVFEEFVNELYNPYGESTLHFKDIYSYLLFECEYSGQISDGKYENAKPNNHYYWLSKAKCVIDGNEYYEGGGQHAKTYTFSSWDSHIKKALKGQTSSYDWTVRDYYMCKLASVLSESVVKGVVDASPHGFESMAETWGYAVQDNKDYNAMVGTKPFYKEYAAYASAVSSIDNEQVFNSFAKSNYSMNDFVKARVSAEQTINSYKSM
ncbi:hypothetical protein [uncultured Methanobrevibacter sp.]|uniref:hypothetical protein n=1 Tax=uncultured Methanobrevibacter sp. TaxID=253161 RepID=UPI0025F6B307|nr:hypothetical protein [uncultured Methanobrevibacter sp.]